MKERPILMSGAMVCATLDGRKTKTRRVVVPTMTPPRVAPLHMEPWIIDGDWQEDGHGLPCWAGFHPSYPGEAKWFTCPYGKPGDRLWVRETWSRVPATAYRASTGVQQTICPANPSEAAIYRADWDRSDPGTRWRPSIHMPRWASRITLEIVSVGVERVQDITAEDAEAEGVGAVVPAGSRYDPRDVFYALWDQINEKRGYGWAVDPWVWVIEFKRVTK